MNKSLYKSIYLRLELVYALIAHRGFESLLLRQNPDEHYVYRDIFLYFCVSFLSLFYLCFSNFGSKKVVNKKAAQGAIPERPYFCYLSLI